MACHLNTYGKILFFQGKREEAKRQKQFHLAKRGGTTMGQMNKTSK